MSGGFDIQSFFKSVSSSPGPSQPEQQQTGPPPGTAGGLNQVPPPHLPPGFGAPPPPGYVHPQQFQGPPPSGSAPFPFHLLAQQQQYAGGNLPQHPSPPFQGGNPGPENMAGANLMALLRGPSPAAAGPQFPNPNDGPLGEGPQAPNGVHAQPPQDIVAPVATRPTPPSESAAPTAPPLSFAPSSPPPTAPQPSWFRGKAKKGTGRVLTGAQQWVVFDHDGKPNVSYDVDERLPGETQPQLEVHTISKVPLEYRLEAGREIAVNRNYICYGMKTGSVRILSQVEDAKVLLKEHTQRLSDLAIFAEDVNLLASASSDGRVFLHEVVGRGKKDTKARPIMGLQFPPENGPLRVAWNPRQQEHLAISQGRSFYLAEVSRIQQLLSPPQDGEPAPVLPIDPAKLPEGLRLVGTHSDVILDVSFSPAGDRIASASKDGSVKIWGGEGDKCLSNLQTRSGETISSVRFVAAPGRADDVVMVSGGPVTDANKWVVNLWAAKAGGDVPGGWQCVQTVTLFSSGPEKAFFIHLHVDHRSGLVFLANTLRKSMYVLNLEHGTDRSTPAAFTYLAEFSFTAPILSFTTLNEGLVDGEETVEIYTVQPEKIQRYALDASLCRPPPPEDAAPAPPPVSAPAPLSPLLLSQLAEKPPASQKPLVPEVPSAPSADRHASPPKQEEPSAPSAPEGLEGLGPRQAGVSSDLTREFSGREHGHVNLGVGSRGLVQNMNELKKQVSRSRTGSPSRPQGLETAKGVEMGVEGGGKKEPEGGVRKGDQAQAYIDLTTGEIVGIPGLESKDKVGKEAVEAEEATLSLSGTPKQEPPTMPEEPKAPEGPKASAPPQADAPRPSAALLTPSSLAILAGAGREEPQQAAAPSKEEASATEVAMSPPEKAKAGRQNVGSPPKAKGGNSVRWAQKGGGVPEVVSSAPAVEGLSYEDIVKGVAAKKEEPKSKKEPTKILAAPPATASVAALAVPPLEKKEAPVSDKGPATRAPPEEPAGPSEGEKTEPDKKRKGKEKERGPAQAEAEAASRAEKLEDVTAALQTGPPSEAAPGEGLVDPAALTAGGFVLVGPTKGRKKNKGGNQAAPTAGPPAPPPAEPTPTPVLAPLPPPPTENTSELVLQQVLAGQREVLKQLGGGVATAVGKEGKRIEAALGLRLEKVIKANAEAQLARGEEERARRERAEKLRMDTALQAITGALSRDLPALVEKSVKKELAAAAPAMSKLLSPAIEKSVQEALVKGDGNKDLSQLEKTVGAKLEAALSRQVQAQFQTTLKAALQESLRTAFQGLLLPSFEAATRAMFEQIEGALRGGMAEQAQQAQQAGAAANGALAGTLQETIASASALVATLQSEIAEGQRKLVALAEASGKQRTSSLSKQVNGGLPDGAISLQHVEESLDPTKELSRLLGAGKYEEAFLKALNAFDVPMVTWLCNQVDPNSVFSAHPLPLSQGVLLSLVSQLGSDLAKDTAKKLDWISQAVLAINPEDPLLAPHMRPYLEQLYQNVHAQLQTAPSGGDVSRSLRTIIHVVNSLLTSCK